MKYHVLGEEVQINSISKPVGMHGSVFEFKGDKSLEKIGLKETFYFRMPYNFSVEYPEAGHDFVMKIADTDHLKVLSLFLEKCISNKEMVSQYHQN